MNAERRRESRYPTWLPGTLWNPAEARATPVRVVDLSFSGAALEGPFRATTNGPLKLQIEWSSIRLTLDSAAVRWSLDDVPPTVAVRFDGVGRTERLLLGALIAAVSGAAEQPAAAPCSRRRKWLRLLSGEPSEAIRDAPRPTSASGRGL